MADVIARLQVDSSQYDQKLKKAVEQMTKMEQEVRRTGATFEFADKAELEFVRSLGQMESSSTSARTKMMEYTNAIASLTATYRAMTDEERKSDFGRGLSASIDELKVKAATLKDIMSDTNIELTNLASDTSFTDGLGLMTRTVGSCAAAITAWSGKGKEMDEIVKELAKIGATVAAVDSLTKAFQKQNLVLLKNPYVAAAAAVVALGVAIGKIIQKSQELSAVEKALQDVQAKGRENAAKEVARIETLNNILHDNTRSLDERRSALAQIQSLVPDYHGALTAEGTLINDNTGAIDDYIDSLQRAATAQAAFDRMVELQKTKMEKQVELQKAQKELEYQQSKASEPVSTSQMMAQAGSGRNVYGAVSSTNQTLVDAAQGEVNKIQKVIDEQDAQINALRELVKANDLESPTSTTTSKGGKTAATGVVTTKELNPLQEAQRKISELSTEALTADEARKEAIRQEIKGLQAQVAAYKQIQDYVQGIKKDEEPQEAETTMSGPSMSAFEKLQQSIRIKLADQNFEVDQSSLTNLLQVAIQNGITGLDGAFENLQYQLGEGLNIPDEAWEKLVTQINEKLAELNLPPITLDVKTGGVKELGKEVSTTTEHVSAAAQAFSALGNAMGQIEDPGAKVAGLIANAVASIASGYGQAVEQAGNGSAGGPWGWIAFAISGLATMISTIAAVKSATAGSYANGGLIPGSSFSGDNLTANVNSGELILNRAQQGSIAGQLQNNPLGNLQLTSKVRGSDLLIVLDNTNSSRGGQRGMYVNVR